MKKIFLVISIISVLFLAGCSKNVVENGNNQVQEEQSNNQNINSDVNTDTLPNTNSVKKLDESKDIVYKAYERKIKIEDVQKPFICEYPYINIDSREVEIINNKINGYVETVKKLKEEIYYDIPSLEVPHDYYISINDNILTVVLGSWPPIGEILNAKVCGFFVDEVYNINIHTGELLNTEEILRITNNISINDINLKDIYNEMFANSDDIPAEVKDEFRKNSKLPERYSEANLINDAYNKYLDYYADKTIEDIPWFLDENNNIIAEMYYYTPYGATDGSIITEQINITEIIKDNNNNY